MSKEGFIFFGVVKGKFSDQVHIVPIVVILSTL